MADPNSEYRSLARSVGRLPSLLYLSTLQCHVICFTRNGRRSTNLKLQVRFCSFRPVCLQLEIPGSTPSSSPASCWMLPMARYFCAVTSLPEAIPRNSAKPVFRIWFGTSVCLLDGSYHNPEARGQSLTLPGTWYLDATSMLVGARVFWCSDSGEMVKNASTFVIGF